MCLYMQCFQLNRLTSASVYIYAHIKFPWTAMGVYIYALVEESLCNRPFIGHYNLWLIRLLVQLFPKGVVVVLYMVSNLVLSTAKNIY